MLKELLTNEPALPLSIDASAREVITEVGNILLNACLGTFGNLLKVQVSFSVPQLSLESLGAILEIAARQPGRACSTPWSCTPASSCATTKVRGYPRHRPQRGVARPADPRGRRMGASRAIEPSSRPRRDAARRRDCSAGSRSSPIAASSRPTIARRADLEPVARGADRLPALGRRRTLAARALSDARGSRARPLLSRRARRRSARALRALSQVPAARSPRNFQAIGLSEMAQSARIAPLTVGRRRSSARSR